MLLYLILSHRNFPLTTERTGTCCWTATASSSACPASCPLVWSPSQGRPGHTAEHFHSVVPFPYCCSWLRLKTYPQFSPNTTWKWPLYYSTKSFISCVITPQGITTRSSEVIPKGARSHRCSFKGIQAALHHHWFSQATACVCIFSSFSKTATNTCTASNTLDILRKMMQVRISSRTNGLSLPHI